jgi:uncharacterized protein involved in response to NO
MADLWYIIVVTSAICGMIAYTFAKHTGRNLARWTALGVAFNLFTLAWVCRPRRRH